MRLDSGVRNYLEEVFCILQFRRRGLVSFRRFVILRACRTANRLREEEADTQPLRVAYQ